uniref:Uncharacterized protein n=1 Tax=Arundo donax TaxID=35708 RepID=A0A0A9ED86_ARUDO
MVSVICLMESRESPVWKKEKRERMGCLQNESCSCIYRPDRDDINH